MRGSTFTQIKLKSMFILESMREPNRFRSNTGRSTKCFFKSQMLTDSQQRVRRSRLGSLNSCLLDCLLESPILINWSHRTTPGGTYATTYITVLWREPTVDLCSSTCLHIRLFRKEISLKYFSVYSIHYSCSGFFSYIHLYLQR